MRTGRLLGAALCVAAFTPFVLLAQATTRQDSVRLGGRVVEAGATVDGPVVVAGGNLDVRGTIRGSAVAIAGDVIVAPGGEVTGDVVAAFGDVRNEGLVGGNAVSLTGLLGASLRELAGPDSDVPAGRTPVQLAVAWFLVMMLLALGVVFFAGNYLDGVVDVLELSFWRSFVVGIAGQLGVLPAVLLACVALAITVVGVLLIPFAIVAIMLGVIGLAALGFVAVARVTGGALTRGAGRSAMRAVILGVGLYLGVWIVVALASGTGGVGSALRSFAIIVTWVAATTGFGAALLSRAGTRRDAGAPQVAPAPDVSWQTPTPVSGVAAARRPVRTGTTSH